MNLVEQERKRREQEAKSNRGLQTPAQAQEPTVLTNSSADFRAPRSATTQTYQRQTPTQTPSPTQTPAPSRTPAPQVTPSRTRGASVDAFDPNSGRKRPDNLGFYQGWWRDRVRENLTDEDGDGRYEVPFWIGLGNTLTPGRRSNQEIADNRRNRERDEQARAIARGSGVQDQIPMDDNRLYNPDEIKARVDQINRGREVGDAEDVQDQELEVIDRTNAPTLEQIASGERQNRDTNQSNLTLGRENNQSAETMNSSNNDTTRRGQDNERDVSLLGMQNDLDLAGIQRLAGQDQITAQNNLAQMQYNQQLEMWRMDRDDRKEERNEDRRSDSLSALLAGLAALGASFAM